MRTLTLMASCLVLAGTAWSQAGAVEAAAKQDKNEGKKAYQALSAQFDEAMAAYRAAIGKVTSSKEYKEALAEARKTRNFTELRKLTSTIKRIDYNAWAQRFADGAKAFAGQPAEVDFLLWTLKSNKKDIVEPSVNRLVGKHIRSKKLGELAKGYFSLARTLGQEDASKVIDKIVAESPHKDVQATALFWRAYPIVNHRPRPGAAAPSAEQKAKAKADMERILEIAPNSNVALKVQGPEFEKKHLQIGMVAPDIEGEDLDGVKFKLSDYRGKVVVLDFWGDW